MHDRHVDNGTALTEPVAVRSAIAGDVEQIRTLALGNGMFAPEDMGGFDDGLQGGSLEGHRWLVATGIGDRVVGAAYYAPEPFRDHIWNLYFLAVDPGQHRQGVGTSLVMHVERTLRSEGEERARVLIVETSRRRDVER